MGGGVATCFEPFRGESSLPGQEIACRKNARREKGRPGRSHQGLDKKIEGRVRHLGEEKSKTGWTRAQEGEDRQEGRGECSEHKSKATVRRKNSAGSRKRGGENAWGIFFLHQNSDKKA